MMKKQKNKLAGLQKRKAIAGYLFISPFIIGFLAFMVKPLLQSLHMSFSEVSLGSGNFTLTFNKLENLKYAFRVDPDYTRLLVEELGRMVVYSLVRAIFFLPVILSSGVILGLETNNQLMATLAAQIEDTTSGVSITAALEEILRTSGVGVRAFEKVFEVIDNIYDVAIASGIQIIIFLSGLQTISSSMYEAADIEGCTKWESLWKITFPMISSMFLVNWIYTVVDFCMRSDNEVIKKIQSVMIDQMQYGRASAMSWVYFIVVLAFIGISSFLISKEVYYYD